MVAKKLFANSFMNVTHKSTRKWEITLIDTGDGSGDCYVKFPSKLLLEIGWHEGDVINIEVVGGQLRLTKVSV